MDKILMREKFFGNNYGNIVPLTISALRTEKSEVISGLIKEFKSVIKFDKVV